MRNKLKDDIKQIREELAQIDSGEEFPDHFQALNSAIDQLEKDAELNQTGELSDQLSQMVTEFEIDHPKLHKLITSVMKTLGDIGI